MEQKIKNLITEALKNLNIEGGDFIVEHPADLTKGDYSTNVAMVFSKKLNTNPKDLAEKIVTEITKLNLDGEIEKISVAGPGFINFYLSREFFTESVKDILNKGENWGRNEILTGKKVMVEYTQPNPFKPFHIGHLMSNAIGESISRIVEFSGAKTVRANYQGDVGPHVAKAIYGILNSDEYAKNGISGGSSVSQSALWIGECYSKGSDFYDNNEDAKKEIDILNKKIYEKSDEKINEIYDWGRKITLEAFEDIYKILGTKFDYYFFESEMAPIGEKIVRENLGPVFEESDGAIVFHAEKYNSKLHTRVFINSKGLPTYETKEIGLTTTKFIKENPDLSIVTTAIEQAEYMKVVEQALILIRPEYASRMKHITHGMMRLASGKMSSRKGNVVTGESLLRDSMDIVLEKVKDRDFSEAEKKEISERVGVAALRYSILHSTTGSDIIFDFEKSISFEGDSGPYLQYSAIRAQSVLNKAGEYNNFSEVPEIVSSLEKRLYRFPEVVTRSYQELQPHYIATYLTELASEFNSFYANTKILNSEDKCSEYYLALTKSFLLTMSQGLQLLGISLPNRM
ncbi:MAG: arginine--tRNA ligase [Minisyncoccia bacterium]